MGTRRRLQWSRPAAVVAALALAAVPGHAPASHVNNNHFENAIVIEVLPYEHEQYTGYTGRQDYEPILGCGGGAHLRTAWYRWTAGEPGIMIADTYHSSYDTVLAVYRGPSTATLEDLERVECNDDDWLLSEISRTTSVVRFQAELGTTYYFQLGGYQDAVGTAVFHLARITGQCQIALRPCPLP